MPRVVELTHDYPVEAGRVWELATSYDALAKVMEGRASFEGLPEGRTISGQKMDVMVRVLGFMPPQPYHMHVVECDDDAMLLRSHERGAGVKSWHHTLRVVPTTDGCRLTDHIEIEAGWLTPLFAAWARFMYGARDMPRRRLLGVA